jgi:hypothetical protein
MPGLADHRLCVIHMLIDELLGIMHNELYFIKLKLLINHRAVDQASNC